MLIDASTSDLRTLIDLIFSLKWRLTVAFDGVDGFNKAVLNQPDLILLDLCWHQMNGFATCRRLKADPNTSGIPLIFLTAANSAMDRLNGLRLGAVDYIGKPYPSAEEVLMRMNIHIKLAQRPHAAPAAMCDSDGATGSPLVRAALQVLRENLATPPSPEALARHLGVNEKRLNEAFHRAFSLPVFAWLREERLCQAQRLLQQSTASIADIAAHCGYASPANFSTAFRERFACTPSELRKRAASGIPGRSALPGQTAPASEGDTD